MSYIILLFTIVFIFICIVFIYYQKNTQYKTEDVSYIIENKKLKDKTILDLLKFVANKYPTARALKMQQDKKWKSITYLDYYKKVKLFAECTNHWLGDSINVAILGFNSPGWFYAHLGAMMNGGKSIGIYTTATPDICEHIIRDSNVELLVVEDDKQLEKIVNMENSPIKLIIYYSPINKKMIDKFKIPLISMGNFMFDQGNKLKNIHHNIDDVATIIYTSGTTGMPKGAMITHRNIMSSVKKIINFVKTQSSIESFGYEQLISYLPLNHIAAQMMDIYLPIAILGTVWFADKEALKSTLGKTIKAVKPTIFIGVPRVWEKITESVDDELKNIGWKGNITKTFIPWKIVQKIGLDRCKLCISAAAPISDSARDYLRTIGISLYDTYGMSETSGPISISAPGVSRKYSVGLPIMDVKITKFGEIIVKGENLFKGYHNDKKETKNAFTEDGWFKTGDLGKIDTDGYLYVTGRKKELIVTAGGENISPIPIENLLREKIGKYFENIIVVGDKRKFISVLLNAGDKTPTHKVAIINTAIDETNSKAPSAAHAIKKWIIIEDKFTIGNELTPTLKLRRSFIQTKYKKQIDALYV